MGGVIGRSIESTRATTSHYISNSRTGDHKGQYILNRHRTGGHKGPNPTSTPPPPLLYYDCAGWPRLSIGMWVTCPQTELDEQICSLGLDGNPREDPSLRSG